MVVVEDKDPIVVIVFFLSVFLSRVVFTSDDVSVFFFQLSRYTKKSGFFLDGWDASLFFILDFFVCDFKTLNPKDSVKGKGVSFVPLIIRRTILN